MEPRTFEAEKDLLTATLKKRRDKLINRYKVVKKCVVTNFHLV